MENKINETTSKKEKGKLLTRIKQSANKVSNSKLYKKIKEKTPKKVKTFLKDYKNLKTISIKQKILHIVPVALVILIFVISLSGGKSIGHSSAVSALYSNSAMPYGVVGVYGNAYSDVSYGEALSYMFKNPKVDTKKDDGDTLVTISGKYRWQVGGSYSSYGEITFRIKNSGYVMVEQDPYGMQGAIQSVAMALGKNY